MDPASDLLVRQCGWPLAQAEGESSPRKERKSECPVCSGHLPPSLDRFGFEADKFSVVRGFSVRILSLGSDRNELRFKQAGSFSGHVRELTDSEGSGRQAWRLGSQKQCPKSHRRARMGEKAWPPGPERWLAPLPSLELAFALPTYRPTVLSAWPDFFALLASEVVRSTRPRSSVSN